MVFINHAQKFKWLPKKKVVREGGLSPIKSKCKKIKYVFNTLHLSCFRKYHATRAHKFPKNLTATLNSSHQTAEMKQVPNSGPRNIKCHIKCVKYNNKKMQLDSMCYTHTVYWNSKFTDTYLQVFLLFLAHNLKLVCHLHLSDPLGFLGLAAQFLMVFFSQRIQCCTCIFHLSQFVLQSFIIHCNKNNKLIK